jgi:uncharacterized protein
MVGQFSLDFYRVEDLISRLMKIDIRQIKDVPKVFHLSETAEELDIAADGAKFPFPVEVEFTATLSGDEMICQADVTAEVELECGRCLEIYNLPLYSRLQFVVQLMDMSPEITNDDDDFEIISKSQAELEIGQRVREAVILNLPFKPLCSDDCKGLCPMCGADLNETPCDCVPDKTDDRWDVLKNLFDDQIE